MYLEIKLQYASSEWPIGKLKYYKIGRNEKIKCKQAIMKVLFFFFRLRNTYTKIKSTSLEVVKEGKRSDWFIYQETCERQSG